MEASQSMERVDQHGEALEVCRERDAEEERLGGDAQQRRHGQLISGSLKIGTQGCSLGTAGVSPRRPQPRSGRHTGGRPPSAWPNASTPSCSCCYESRQLEPPAHIDEAWKPMYSSHP